MNQSAKKVFIPSNSTRRDFLAALGGGALLLTAPLPSKPLTLMTNSLGIAYPSFAVRSRLARQPNAEPLTAERLIQICRNFGARGCQLDVASFALTDAASLKRIRARLEEAQMFLELSVGAEMLGDESAFNMMAGAAKALGVTRLRAAMLNGRRYEDFHDLKKWKEFVAQAERRLAIAEPLLRRHKLIIGIENHKDWLADELASMLRRFSSSYLGACIDFGNNLALLEDSVAVVEKLAPYVVTTHLKDMALRPEASGFQLSEVPLGTGFLPLAQFVRTLRRHRPDVHFCLEMITRDPLHIPYLSPDYWATYPQQDEARIARFQKTVLVKASSQPLPHVNHLSAEQMLSAEDENIRRSLQYARQNLNL
jgi:sugar phosphate isomerase/epimerase